MADENQKKQNQMTETSNKKKKKRYSKVIPVLFLACLLVLTGLISYTSVRFIYGRQYQMANQEVEYDDEVINDNLLCAIFLDDPETPEVDYIALRDFNTNVNKVNVIMFPTDAMVSLTKERRKSFQSIDGDVEKTIYLTDIGTYFGSSVEKYEETVKVLEDVFGEEIPSYEALNFEDFKEMVNLLDPIEFELDSDLTYYTKNGNVSLMEKGTIEVGGTRALGLVTFMDKDQRKEEIEEENSTRNTELDPATTTNNTNKTISTKTNGLDENGRIRRASNYLKQYVGEAMRVSTRDEMIEYINDYYQVLSGNGNVGDVTKYIDNFMDLKESRINFYTVKGKRNENGYEINSEKSANALANMMEEVKSEEDSKKEKKIEDSKTLELEVINGAYIQGFAAEWKKKLEKDGYTVVDIGTYDEEAVEDGILIVSEEGMGEDLREKYFPNAKIEVGEIESGADIQIILGITNRHQDDEKKEE